MQIFMNHQRPSTSTDVPSVLDRILPVVRVQVLNMKFMSTTTSTSREPRLVAHVSPIITKEMVSLPPSFLHHLDLLRHRCHFLQLSSATHPLFQAQALFQPALKLQSLHMSFKETSWTPCCWGSIKHIQHPNFRQWLPPFTTLALWRQRISVTVMSLT